MVEVVSLLNQKICSLETMASLLDDYDICYDHHEDFDKDYHFIDFYNREPQRRFRLDLMFAEKKLSINHMSNVIELPIVESTVEQINLFFNYVESILVS